MQITNEIQAAKETKRRVQVSRVYVCKERTKEIMEIVKVKGD
jgi:hypothetical protein